MVIMVIMMEISVISFAIYSGLHSGLLFDPMEAKRGMSLSFLFNVRKPDLRKAYQWHSGEGTARKSSSKIRLEVLVFRIVYVKIQQMCVFMTRSVTMHEIETQSCTSSTVVKDFAESLVHPRKTS